MMHRWKPGERAGRRVGRVCWVAALLACAAAEGQIVRDGTMGPMGPLNGPDFTIPHTDGSLRSNNLFHSFSQFNINTGESATFTGPANIANVISRVTGGSRSTIDGLLATSGMPNANFFLINPAGVLFGPGAQIDVPAAFVATTADVLELADGGRFAATIDPQQTVLTTAPPSAFGFLSDSPASIELDGADLAVGAGQTISLVGGDIRIGSELAAPSGRISLVSVASPGVVTHKQPDQTADADVDAYGPMGTIDLVDDGSEDTTVTVAGDPGGTIVIRGGQLVLEGAVMTARTDGAADHPGTGVDIHVSGDVILTGTAAGGGAEIASSSGQQATGGAGNLRIAAETVQLSGEATSGEATNIGSRSFGAGDAGDVDITADRVTLTDHCFISAPALGSGNGGDITIVAGEVELFGQNGSAYISTLSQGGGAAGNIDITADRFVAVGGSQDPADYAGVSTQTKQAGGQPGLLKITADEIELWRGAQLNATLFEGSGTGGDIEINAGSLLISGWEYVPPQTYNMSGIFTSAGWQADGKGGSVNVTADSVTVTNYGMMRAGTDGLGDAGAVNITADEVNVTWSGAIRVSTTTAGKAGTVTILATTVDMNNTGTIYAGSWYAPGEGGSIQITTDTLSVRNRSYVSGTAFHWDPGVAAPGGSLEINARAIYLAGPETADDPFNADFSGLSTGSSFGRGGDMLITAETMEMTNRASISALVGGAEPAGNMVIDVGRIDVLSGSIIQSTTLGSGTGGNLTITSDHVRVSGVHPQPFGFVGEEQLAPSGIAAETGFGGGQAGTITIDTGNLEVLDGGIISASTVGGGSAGAIEVAADSVAVSGFNAVKLQYLLDHGDDPRYADSAIITATSRRDNSPPPEQMGDAGLIRIQADQVAVSRRGHITSETDNHGAGGHIELDVGSLAVTTEGQIRSAGTGMGDAGTIRVGASGSLNMDGGASITTSADQANAGDLIVSAARGLYLIDSEIAARAAGDGGNIELTAGGEMRLFDGRITTRAGGTGGNITIASPFCLFDHARLSADASLGNGGNILIATDVFLESGSLITASSEFGIAGTIEITAPLVDLAGTLAPLPENLWAGEVRLADPCVTRFLRGSSSFVVGGREGLPMAPGALLPSLELPAAGPAEPQGEGGETPVTVP